MSIYQKIIVGGVVLALTGLTGLVGCEDSKGAQSSNSAARFQDRGIISKVPGGNNLTGYGVALGDVDGDGDLDMMIIGPLGVRYLEKTSEGFQNRGIISKVPGGNNLTGYGVALGDVDGDGDLDMMIIDPLGVRYLENKIPQKNK